VSSRTEFPVAPVCGKSWLRYLLGAFNTVTHLSVAHGQLHARIGDGDWHAVTVAGESRIGTRLTLLKIRPVTTRSSWRMVVLVNLGPSFRNVPPEEFRRLRMWLRLGQHHATPPAFSEPGAVHDRHS
jgi:toxin CptA